MYYLPQRYSPVNHQTYTFHSIHHSPYPPQCPPPSYPNPTPNPQQPSVCFLRLRVSYGFSPSLSHLVSFFPSLPPRPPALPLKFLISQRSYDNRLSLIDLFHLACMVPSSSIHVIANGKILCFLWLHSIPLYIYTTTSLSIHLLMDIQVLSIIWLLWTLLL